MKYCFIINSQAGKGGMTAELEERINEVCSTAAADYEIFVSGSLEDTYGYISETAQRDGEMTFIACGGDGTLCRIADAVMKLTNEQRERVRVGVIPMGTGNDFVSNFKNKELFLDIGVQLDATPIKIDLLKCNDVYSVNMVNIGFDCQVVCQKEQIGKKVWVPRKLAYVFSLAITLIRKPGAKMEFSCDGEKKTRKELLLTTLANGAFCGGGFRSNPMATINDGKIDCIAVKDIGRIKFVSLVGSYKKGLHLGKRFKKIIDHFKCERADMYFDAETPVSIDGEIVRTKELHMSVVRNALTFMVPRGVVAVCGRAEDAAAAAVTQ